MNMLFIFLTLSTTLHLTSSIFNFKPKQALSRSVSPFSFSIGSLTLTKSKKPNISKQSSSKSKKKTNSKSKKKKKGNNIRRVDGINLPLVVDDFSHIVPPPDSNFWADPAAIDAFTPDNKKHFLPSVKYELPYDEFSSRPGRKGHVKKVFPPPGRHHAHHSGKYLDPSKYSNHGETFHSFPSKAPSGGKFKPLVLEAAESGYSHSELDQFGISGPGLVNHIDQHVPAINENSPVSHQSPPQYQSDTYPDDPCLLKRDEEECKYKEPKEKIVYVKSPPEIKYKYKYKIQKVKQPPKIVYKIKKVYVPKPVPVIKEIPVIKHVPIFKYKEKVVPIVKKQLIVKKIKVPVPVKVKYIKVKKIPVIKKIKVPVIRKVVKFIPKGNVTHQHFIYLKKDKKKKKKKMGMMKKMKMKMMGMSMCPIPMAPMVPPVPPIPGRRKKRFIFNTPASVVQQMMAACFPGANYATGGEYSEDTDFEDK